MRLLKRLAKVLGLLLGLLLVAGCATGLWVWSELRGSLPRVSGGATVPGLEEEVRIERDALGVPTVTARTERDAAAALGWLHGQERFFQMDLMRRRAAGELSALVGAATVNLDRGARVHRFRWRAGRVLAAAPAADRAILEAYTAGVNAGLTALRSKPVEYLLLRSDPEPWLVEDSFLVFYNMFLELQDASGSTEITRGALYRYLDPELAAFLDAPGTEWDAPIVGEAMTRRAPEFVFPPSSTPVVGQHVRESHTFGSALVQGFARTDSELDGPALGSNNWAVAGAHTADGRAWVANDVHLGLQLPNTWYRAQIRWRQPSSADVTGVTLPGAPGVVVGSNGHVAWGFTNGYGDWSDVVLVRVGGARAGHYRRAGGSEVPFQRHVERIEVKGASPVRQEVRETIWGPVIGAAPDGDLRALRWTAHDVEAVNLHLFRMASARSLDEALDIAARSGIPAQNLVAIDRDGHIGWTICGRIPVRKGPNVGKNVPMHWDDPSWGPRWEGYYPPEEYPRVVDPPSGRIWTANARVVDESMLAMLGDGGYALGARAQQIRDDLMAIEKATPRDLLDVQLDDRALFFERWRKLLLERLTPEAMATKPLRGEARKLLERWNGRASVDAVGFRIVRGFRLTVSRDVWSALTARCRVDVGFRGPLWQFEGPLWQLLHRGPRGNVPPPFLNWNDYLLDALDRTLADMTKDGTPLREATWGKRNTVRVSHPLAQGMPSLSRWLDMPALELPGGDHMPRVQSPTEGASQRMVVSPGLEEQGFFHMPGGQSGHPSSPHYGDGHAAWANGEPTPFLPGPAVDVLVLRGDGNR